MFKIDFKNEKSDFNYFRIIPKHDFNFGLFLNSFIFKIFNIVINEH